MNIKYFDNFTGTWLDVSGATGAALEYYDASGWVTSVGYKKWVGNLTQTGTSAPTATIFENTLGVTLNYNYVGVGKYSLASDNIFTTNKTVVFINNNATGYIISTELSSDDAVIINTIESDTLNTSNGILNKTSIEIRVYN